ncbi:MAG: nucleotide exchange factor GrpE [Anaerolineales bacterium]|nr:nucleotide exchange factor GrpE [Anaerolineales bacterium]
MSDDSEKVQDEVADAPVEAIQGDEDVNGREEDVAGTAEPTLEEQLAAAKAEAARNLDGWMRVQAEFANARKRFDKQQAEAYTNATAEVVTKLLPVIDDFERAMATVPDSVGDNGWLEGISLVYRKLNNILDGFNVQPIASVGQPFDPLLHEAIMQEESDEYNSGVVTRELQKGYKLGERVMRPALVYVAA